MTNITFRSLTLDDIPMLCGWLNQPHMRAFYQKSLITIEEVSEKYLPRIAGHEPTYSHIVMWGNLPFGKIQSYKIEDYPDWSRLINIKHGIGIDLFIGYPDMLGKGFGSKMLLSYIHTVVDGLFPDQSPIYITHDKKNHVALACSKKVGFEYLYDFIEDDALSELLVLKRDNSIS